MYQDIYTKIRAALVAASGLPEQEVIADGQIGTGLGPERFITFGIARMDGDPFTSNRTGRQWDVEWRITIYGRNALDLAQDICTKLQWQQTKDILWPKIAVRKIDSIQSFTEFIGNTPYNRADIVLNTSCAVNMVESGEIDKIDLGFKLER